MDWRGATRMASSAIRNILRSGESAFVTEPANWAVQWDGRYITHELQRQKLLHARLTFTSLFLRENLIHFGSFRTYLIGRKPYRSPRPSVKVITVFHIQPGNKQYDVLVQEQERLAVIHTSAQATVDDLRRLGVASEKIRVVPLGVDRKLFRPSKPDYRQQLRHRLGIPLNRIVIGSFQKDGVGWAAGMEPKLEKGPDVFAQTMALLHKQYPIFVLLVGPARGYLEQKLRRAGVPYRSVGYVAHYGDVAAYYQALDLYLIASRVEGGPKALLESWASGVPVVSTRMGMVADVAKHAETALLAPVGDAIRLAAEVSQLLLDPVLREKMVTQGMQEVARYDWSVIAQRYYRELYQPLLSAR